MNFILYHAAITAVIVVAMVTSHNPSPTGTLWPQPATFQHR